MTGQFPADSKPPWSVGLHDQAIASLDEQQREWLQSRKPFLCSLGYALHYHHPSADRVAVIADGNGGIRAGFYRSAQWFGVLAMIEFVGFPDLTAAEVRDVLVAHRAHGSVRLVMRRPNEPDAPSAERNVTVTHDVIADLPNNSETYLRSLGRQKRQQLPRYWRRLEREGGGPVHFEVVDGPAIELQAIEQLVQMNQGRMAALGRGDSTIEECQRQRRRAALTAQQGLLCRLFIGDQVIGGTFNYVHGDEAFLVVIAHDSNWERFHAGHLALWRTVETCIGRGVRRYHFFWGRKQYKNEFGGVDHRVDSVIAARRAWMLPCLTLLHQLRFNLSRGLKWAARKLRGSSR